MSCYHNVAPCCSSMARRLAGGGSRRLLMLTGKGVRSLHKGLQGTRAPVPCALQQAGLHGTGRVHGPGQVERVAPLAHAAPAAAAA